jgi:hypothetical protein
MNLLKNQLQTPEQGSEETNQIKELIGTDRNQKNRIFENNPYTARIISKKRGV